jgi:hypothetical protein
MRPVIIIPVRGRVIQLNNLISSISGQTVDFPTTYVAYHGRRSDYWAHERVHYVPPCGKKETWCKGRLVNDVASRLHTRSETIIIQIDADMILAPNALELVLDEFSKEPRSFVIAENRSLPKDYAPFLPMGMIPWEELYEKAIHIPFSQGKRSIGPPSESRGCLQAYPLSWLADIGGHDENLEIYGADDVDLWRRAKLSKLNCVKLGPIMLHQYHEIDYVDEEQLKRIKNANERYSTRAHMERRIKRNGKRNPFSDD